MNRSRFRTFAYRFPQSYKVDQVTVALPLKVPAFGYAALTIEPGEKSVPTRGPMTPTLATSERSMSNGILSVEAGAGGTVKLTDLRSGHVYERLLTIEDVADIGDGWYHGPAVNDHALLSTGSPAEVEWVHDTPLLSTLRVRVTLNVPESFDFASMRRASKRVPLVVETDLTLRRGADWLDVTSRVVNNVKDHRVRVLLPSGATTTTWQADSAFDVVERPIALDPQNHTFRELQVETSAMHSFAAVHDATRGLAVVATGLKEVAVRDLPDRPLALTLYRSTRRTVFTDGEPDGQLLGRELEFRWRIVPLRGKPDVVALSRHGQQLAADELRLEQFTLADLDPADRLQPTLPATGSLLSIEGAVVVTSLRQRHDGATELRAFNPTDSTSTLRIVPGALRPKHATPTDFEGNPIAATVAASKDGAIELDVPARKIVTLRLE
jgi:alpha-mannosidase/mannosylglycerate hydrolase